MGCGDDNEQGQSCSWGEELTQMEDSVLETVYPTEDN